jgi:predicted Zn-dependent peptidase
MSFQKTKLKSGLRVVTVPVKNANSVTVLLLVGTGSKYETREISGISHFLEHMFFKGTEKRPNTLAISEVLDKIGGQYNAFTSKEVTGYWAKVDKKHSDVALDWISDIFLNSKFDAEELEREKGVVTEELNMYLDMPQSHVGELFEELLYGDTPAGWQIVGTKETIAAYTRDKLIEYYHSHYSNDNTVICVAGDIDEKEIQEKLENLFAKIQVRPAAEKLPVKEEQSKPGILMHHKKTDQTHFCLGVRAYDMYDPRRFALQLIAVMLGGNMSSRLFISVRERHGLGYYIHTSVDSATDTGYLVTQAGIKNDNLEKAVELVLKEYRDLKDNVVSEEELQKAKDYIRGSTSLSLDGTDTQASFYATQEVMNQPLMTPEEKLAMIDKVTVADIKKVAEDIFKNEKLNLSVIGAFEEKDKEKFLNLLAL